MHDFLLSTPQRHIMQFTDCALGHCMTFGSWIEGSRAVDWRSAHRLRDAIRLVHNSLYNARTTRASTDLWQILRVASRIESRFDWVWKCEVRTLALGFPLQINDHLPDILLRLRNQNDDFDALVWTKIDSISSPQGLFGVRTCTLSTCVIRDLRLVVAISLAVVNDITLNVCTVTPLVDSGFWNAGHLCSSSAVLLLWLKKSWVIEIYASNGGIL